MWNIPVTSSLPENSVPTEAVQGQNSFQNNIYNGPCPLFGVHHYSFDLFALDTVLTMNPGATRSELMQAMQDHDLAQLHLVGVYGSSPKAVCGNGNCEIGEDAKNCPQDCKPSDSSPLSGVRQQAIQLADACEARFEKDKISSSDTTTLIYSSFGSSLERSAIAYLDGFRAVVLPIEYNKLEEAHMTEPDFKYIESYDGSTYHLNATFSPNDPDMRMNIVYAFKPTDTGYSLLTFMNEFSTFKPHLVSRLDFNKDCTDIKGMSSALASPDGIESNLGIAVHVHYENQGYTFSFNNFGKRSSGWFSFN